MTLEEEHRLVFNPVHGASLIWRAAKTFVDESGGTEGLPLDLSMYVLPLVLNQNATNAIVHANKASGISRVLVYDRTIRAQLEERVTSLSDLTWRSLFVGCSANVLSLSRSQLGFQIFSALEQQNLPSAVKPLRSELLDMQRAADRLGYWFYNESRLVLSEVLQVAM